MKYTVKLVQERWSGHGEGGIHSYIQVIPEGLETGHYMTTQPTIRELEAAVEEISRKLNDVPSVLTISIEDVLAEATAYLNGIDPLHVPAGADWREPSTEPKAEPPTKP